MSAAAFEVEREMGAWVAQELKDSGLCQQYGINVIGVRLVGDRGIKLKS